MAIITWPFGKRSVSGFKLAPPAPTPRHERWALRALQAVAFLLGPIVAPRFINLFADLFGLAEPLQTTELGEMIFRLWLGFLVLFCLVPWFAVHMLSSKDNADKGMWWWKNVSLRWLFLPFVGWVAWYFLWPFVADLFDRFVLSPSGTMRWFVTRAFGALRQLLRFLDLIDTRYISPWLDYASRYLEVAWRRLFGG